MLNLSPAVQLWYCPDPVDMRLGFDGLFALVRNRLQADPLSGHLFIFRNRTADRLEATIAELEATLKAKRDLVANASHELRTPLASIQGHVESLLMQPDADDQRAYLAVIQREAEHLSRLVDDLFLLSAADAGSLPLDIELVALGDVVESVARSMGPIARRERQITLTTSVADDLGPALADRQRGVERGSLMARHRLGQCPERPQ